MKRILVTYASRRFRRSQQQLLASARRFGLEVRPWDHTMLASTDFYRENRSILDLSRGNGYWIWKPFIIQQELSQLAEDDILIYCDAGVEIVADVSPLVELALDKRDLLLFAGNVDLTGGGLGDTCGEWTKRDCFVLMDADEPSYHQAQMLDASFLVLRNRGITPELVCEWQEYCSRAQAVTDQPNACGLPNLPGFIDHRHDQSVLSLLAVRYGVETFRSASQLGNHMKLEQYRVPGEWLSQPYGSRGVFGNSPYPTLLDHHRSKARLPMVWLWRLFGIR